MSEQANYATYRIAGGKYYVVPIGGFDRGAVQYALFTPDGKLIKELEPRVKNDGLELWKNGERHLILDHFFTETWDPDALPFEVPASIFAEFTEATSAIYSDQNATRVDDSASIAAASGFSWTGYLLAGVATAGAGYFYSQNNESSSDSGSSTVKTPLTITAAAGSFSSAALVSVYSDVGELLGQGQLDPETGTVSITLEVDYTGPALLIIEDINGDKSDYESEATGESVDLDVSLRAMTEIVSGEVAAISITPLTELAARLAGVADSPSLLFLSPVTSTELTYNELLADLFGLDSLTGEVTVLQDSGFDSSNGVDQAELYGELLAILSGADENLGSMDAALDALFDAIQLENGELSLDGSGSELLSDGLATLLEGPYSSLYSGSSIVAGHPVILSGDVINAEQAALGLEILVPNVANGDEIEILLNGTTLLSTTVTEVDDNGDVTLSIDAAALLDLTQGDQELLVSVNGEDRLATAVTVDTITPAISSGATATNLIENSAADTQVYQIVCDDPTATLTLAGDDAEKFRLDAETGAVYLIDSPDYETQSEYHFTVVATDEAGNQSTQEVALSIENLEDIPPAFTSSDSVSIDENTTGLVQTITTDDDTATLTISGDDLVYFDFDSITGELTLTEAGDYDTQTSYSLLVTATDPSGNVSTQTLTVSLNDIATTVNVTTALHSAALVSIYSTDGVLLGQGQLDPETGAVLISFNQEYTGPILLVLEDTNGSESDYTSSVDGSDIDLNTTLRAMAEVGEEGDSISVSITAISELAVILAGVSESPTLMALSPMSEDQLAYNSLLAQLLELADVTGDFVLPDSSAFDSTDGISDAELLGQMLAVFSAAEMNIGSLSELLEELANEISLVNGELVLSGAGGDLLSGALTTLLEGVSGLENIDLDLITGQPVLVTGKQINAEQAESGLDIQVPNAEIGDQIELFIDGVSVSLVDVTEIDEDGNAQISLSSEILLALDDGSQDLSVSVNGDNRMSTEIQVDQTGPELIIEAEDTALAAGESTLVTFTFSEAVTNFSNADIELNGASLTAVSSLDGGITWTAVYTPAANQNSGEVDLSVSTSGITDLAGNLLQDVASATLTIDTTLPTAEITLSNTLLSEGENATVTITFSEQVSGFDLDDLTLTYGTLSDLQISDDGLTYTATLTTPDDLEASDTLTIGNDWSDLSGNQPSQNSQSLDYEIDTLVPVITSGETTENLDENSPADTQVYLIECDDADAVLTLSGDDAALFRLDEETGAAYLIDSPDYETKSLYQFTVVATDSAGNQTTQDVSLTINDLDDLAPVFTSSASASLDENTTGYVQTITTDDPTAVLTISGDDFEHFAFDSETGVLTLVDAGDYEIQPTYSLEVTATDEAGNVSTQTLIVSLNDQDESGPTFLSGSTATAVDENGDADVLVYTIETDDPDAILSLAGDDADKFRLDADTGEVYLMESADYETQSSYSLIVQAEDAMGILVGKTVTLEVNDLDEIAPEITSGSVELSMEEGSGAGTVIYTIKTDDPDATITLEGEWAEYFSYNASTGKLTLLKNLDYDETPVLTATLLATDIYGNSSSVEVTINVTDLVPTITSKKGVYDGISESLPVGSVVYTVTSNDQNAIYGLEGTDKDYFSIDSVTGEVSTLYELDHETKNPYYITVTATDGSGNTTTKDVRLYLDDVDEVPPEFISTGSRSGGYILIETTTDDGDGSGIVASYYDADGNAVGESFAVNTTLEGDQSSAVVTSLSEGGYVVAWLSVSAGSSAIYLRVYDSDNLAVTDEILASSSTLNDLAEPALVALSDSGFLVTWEGSDDDGSGIYAQRYSAEGEAEGSIFQVNSEVSGDQTSVSVVTLADGGFLLIWQSDGQDGSGEGIFAQRYNAIGTAVGDEFQVNSTTDNDQTLPSAATLTNGGLVIVWQSSGGQDGEDDGIFAQLYTAQGSQDGSEIQINSLTSGDQYNPQVSSLVDGGFVVIWQSDASSSTELYARLFDENGDPVSDDLLIASAVNGDIAASVTWLANGGYLVSWQDDSGTTFTQEFDANGTAEDAETEAGSTTSNDLTITSLVDPDSTTLRVDEGQKAGTVIYTPYLTDQADVDDPTDTTDLLTFSLSGTDAELFSIDSDTGEVSLLESLDYEIRSEYQFEVIATDLSGTSVSHLVILSVMDVEEVNVIIDLVQGLSSLDTDGNRVFDADTTYNIYIIVDSDSADLTLNSSQIWYSGQNLGSDDSIILVGDDGEILNTLGVASTDFVASAVEGEGDDLWWGVVNEPVVDETDTTTTDTTTTDTSDEVVTEEEEVVINIEDVDLAVEIDARVITRYYNGEETSINWYVGSSDWSETDSPNSGAAVETVLLSSLPEAVAEELNWS